MHIENTAQVAVLLATYNGAKYLSEFLDSLCHQSFKDFCVYVRDDGSTDETLEIIQSYASKLNLHLLRSSARLGPAKGFLQIMREADSRHSCYLLADQDDFWYEDKIQRAFLALADQRDKVVLYCSRLEYVDKDLQHIGFSRAPRIFTFENALVENVATGCTVGISQRLCAEVVASEPFDVIMHDWWLYMYCTAFGQIIYDPNASIKYRQHGNNAIGAATSRWDDFYRRWVRFRKREGGVHRLSLQSKAFLECYRERLRPEYCEVIERLTMGTHSLVGRIGLAMRPPVYRQRRMDTLLLRCLFLLGRY